MNEWIIGNAVNNDAVQYMEKRRKMLKTFSKKTYLILIRVCVRSDTYLHSSSFSFFLFSVRLSLSLSHSSSSLLAHALMYAWKRHGERIFEPLDFHIFRPIKIWSNSICVFRILMGGVRAPAHTHAHTLTCETILPMCMTNAMCWNVFYWHSNILLASLTHSLHFALKREKDSPSEMIWNQRK